MVLLKSTRLTTSTKSGVSFEIPPSAAGFYRFELPTLLASGEVPARAQERCSRELWDAANLTLANPTGFLSETCSDYLGCEPAEVCCIYRDIFLVVSLGYGLMINLL
jgi:hypothetical protein